MSCQAFKQALLQILPLLLGVQVLTFADQPARPADSAVAAYLLGTGDQISVKVLDEEEISDKPVRIDEEGYINLPVLGRVTATGLTTAGLESTLAHGLSRYLREPRVTVSIVEFRPQPVSVMGAVTSPGVIQVHGQKTLLEVLSMAGGLRNDAGNVLKITRRTESGALPLANAVTDPAGRFSVAQLNVRDTLEALNPEQNIVLRPNDVVSVPTAQLVYVIGSVRRSGGFVLNEKESISVLQALSLAEGLDRTAAAQHSRILRPEKGNQRTEIAVDVTKILAGKSTDVPLKANDILFIPNSAARSAALRGIEAAIQIGTGVVIWRR